MTINEIGFLAVVFFANTIEAITGFAGTMLAMPASMKLLGVNEAKIILNVIAILLSTSLTIKNHKHTDKKEVLKISALMGVGIVIGIYLFSIIPATQLMLLYGLFIIAIAIRGLLSKKEINFSGLLLILIVLAAGVIHGMFLSGGALLVFYAISVLRKKEVIRATLSPVWLILNMGILIQDIVRGNITSEILILSACTLPLLAGALILGNYLHHKIKQEIFIKITYVLLIVSGVLLIF